jgi:hypothetical protein
MILALLILAILILIGVMSLLETTREIEIRTRTFNDDNLRIESELEEIKNRLPKNK